MLGEGPQRRGPGSLPHSATCELSWHSSASGLPPRMCVGGADVCSPGRWPGSEPSWHAPRLPCPAADGSEPLSVQRLSYNSPRGADRSTATISKLLFAQDHRGQQL